MNLQHINIRTQPLHTLLHRIENMLPRQPYLIHILGIISHGSRNWNRGIFFVDAEVAFREDDDFGAGDVVGFEGFGDDAFGGAVGVYVGLDGLVVNGDSE